MAAKNMTLVETLVESIVELNKKVSHVEGKEGTNRELIKALSRRIERVEQGEPPSPQDRPAALRWDEV